MQKINYKIFLKKRKQRISFFSVSPSFDWKFIIIFSTLLLIGGATYIGLLFVKILDESLFIVPEDEKYQLELVQKQEIIQKTVEQIDKRNQEKKLPEVESDANVLTNQ